MTQKHIFESTSSFFNEFFQNVAIKCWIDDVTLFVRLNIVSEDSEIMGLELGNINAFLLLLCDDTNLLVHFYF
jgi:hypothetical protein